VNGRLAQVRAAAAASDINASSFTTTASSASSKVAEFETKMRDGESFSSYSQVRSAATSRFCSLLCFVQ
jgi:hypothetical protein